MKKIKKYTAGGVSDKPKKTVVKSESKNYKTITKGDDTKVKRTVKGVVTKATPVKQTEANRAAYVKTAKSANQKAAERVSGKFLNLSGGNLKGATNVYNKIANQEVTIPKTKEYGDYKKGGSVKRKKKK
jgi:hypothetical protein